MTADALGIRAVYLLGGVPLLLAGSLGLAGLRITNNSHRFADPGLKSPDRDSVPVSRPRGFGIPEVA